MALYARQVGASAEDGSSARVRAWCIAVLGVPARLVQQQAGSRRVKRPPAQGQGSAASTHHQATVPGPGPGSDRDHDHDDGAQRADHVAGGPAAVPQQQQQPPPSVGFANDGQYLLVTQVGAGLPN